MSFPMQKQHPKNNKRRNAQLFGSAIPNQIYGMTFPREMKLSMKYSDTLDWTPSAGFTADVMFNLNSIFDPNRTLTGHQPLGYDQWAQFYNRYRVDATYVHLHLCASDTAGGYFTLLANNSITAITNVDEPSESPISTTATFTQGTPTDIVKGYDLAKVNGVTRAVYNSDDRYQALYGGSPSEFLILHTCWTPGILNTGKCYAKIVITYQVSLFDPIQQTLS